MATASDAPALPADDDGLITRRQVAALLGTTTRTLDKMIGSGQYPRPDTRIPDRVRGEPRWRAGTYRRWLRERSNGTDVAR
jgi:predicted DNA-binding transcriptional regulator AlpA